ncbi:MAG: hypothetical protein EOM51_11315 [Clostridia bacterium]|nr:hypothetical protein [Clostridia bacterium]NCC60391.1 hypothetical protein [Verrucomicrobiae bacterium]
MKNMNLIVLSVACALVLAFSSACSKEESNSNGTPAVTEAQKTELQKAADTTGAVVDKAATDAAAAVDKAAEKTTEAVTNAAAAVKEATTPAK